MHNKLILRQLPWEAFLWLAGLIFLAFSTPTDGWTICPLHNLGFDFCPGCGLGRSVSLIFRGEWLQAWSVHPLGYAALPLLVYRSISLIRFSLTNNNNYHGTSNRSFTGIKG